MPFSKVETRALAWCVVELVVVECPTDPHACEDVDGGGKERVVNKDEDHVEEESLPHHCNDRRVDGSTDTDGWKSHRETEADTEAEAVEGTGEAVGEAVVRDALEEEVEGEDLEGRINKHCAEDVEHGCKVRRALADYLSDEVEDAGREGPDDELDDDFEGKGDVGAEDAEEEGGGHLGERSVAGAADKVEEKPEEGGEGCDGEEEGEGDAHEGGTRAEDGQVEGQSAEGDEGGPSDENDDQASNEFLVFAPDEFGIACADTK